MKPINEHKQLSLLTPFGPLTKSSLSTTYVKKKNTYKSRYLNIKLYFESVSKAKLGTHRQIGDKIDRKSATDP